MKIKFFVVGSVIDFPHNPIFRQKFQKFLEQIRLESSNEMLDDWTLEFHINPTNFYWLETKENDKNFIGVYKKGFIYPNAKEKVFPVNIPIPSGTQVSWGMPEERYLHRPKANPNNFFLIDFDFNEFTNLEDYFLESAKKIITNFLSKGFTVQGNKLKLASTQGTHAS